MQQTIVKKYSQHFKTLNSLSKELGIEVKALNKASEKFISYRSRYYSSSENSYTKGVESDHIKIYPLDKERSFAFAFYYSNIEKPLILVTIKKNKSEENFDFEAAQFNDETFKEKMNQFLKILQVLKESSAFSKTTLENAVRANFIKGQEYNPKLEKDLAREKINKEVLLLKAKNRRNLDLKKELKEEIKSKKKALETKTEEARKKFKIKELQDQLDKAWCEIRKITDKIETDLKIDSDSSKLREVERELYEYNSQVVKIIEKYSAHLPRNLKAEIKKEFIEE